MSRLLKLLQPIALPGIALCRGGVEQEWELRDYRPVEGVILLQEFRGAAAALARTAT